MGPMGVCVNLDKSNNNPENHLMPSPFLPQMKQKGSGISSEELPTYFPLKTLKKNTDVDNLGCESPGPKLVLIEETGGRPHRTKPSRAGLRLEAQVQRVSLNKSKSKLERAKAQANLCPAWGALAGA